MAAVEDDHHQHEEELEDDEIPPRALTPSLPLGRVKKIMKLDRDVKKVNSEALLLVSLAAELFLGSLTARSRADTISKKRRIINADHIRSAVRSHPPTADFLLDCLPPAAAAETAARSRPAAAEKPLPPGARRIEDFFSKPSAAAS